MTDSPNDVPFFFWQPYDVYKRANAAEKKRMRDSTIEAIAMTMDEDTDRSIRGMARAMPHLSPGAIQGLAQAGAARLMAHNSVEAISNENTAVLNELLGIANADAASAAAESSFGATKTGPLPQTPAVLPNGPVTASVPDETDEGSSWLSSFNIFDHDSPVADALGDVFGSEKNPDPSAFDVLKAGPRATFGTIMNVMRGGAELADGSRRAYAGDVAKAKSLQKQYGLTPEDYDEVFGDKVLQHNLPGSDTPLGATWDWMVTPAGNAFMGIGTDDDTQPTNPRTADSIEKARADWQAYKQTTDSDGGVLNETSLWQNLRAGNAMDVPWFGGEANQTEAEPKTEAYSGKVYDTRSWAEKEAAAVRVLRERRRAILDTGLDLNADRIAELDSPRPWTQGRALAGEVLDPESSAYSFLSGTIDFADSLVFDPSTYVPGAAFTTPLKAAARGASKLPGVSKVVRPAFEADHIVKTAKDAAKVHVRSALDRTGISKVPAPSGVKWEAVIGDAKNATSARVSTVTDADGVVSYVVKDIPADSALPLNKAVKEVPFTTAEEALRYATRTRYSKVAAGHYAVRDPQESDVVVEIVKSGKQWVGKDASGTDVVTGKTMREVTDQVSAKWGTTYRMTNDAGEELGSARELPDGRFETDEGVFDSLDEARDVHIDRLTEARGHVGIEEVARYFRDTDEGRRITAAMLEDRSPTSIWLRSKGKIDYDTATKIAQATDHDQLVRILDASVGVAITDPAAFKNYTGIGARMYSTKMKFGEANNRAMQAVFRSMQKAHNTNAIDLGDADDLAEQSWRLGVELGLPQDELIPRIDSLVGQGDPVLRREYFMERFLPDVVDARLKELNVGKGYREKIMASFRESANDMRNQQRIEFKGQPPAIEDVTNEATAYYLLHQGQMMYLPSVRDVRRVTNKLATTLRKNQSDGADTDILETMQKAASGFLDTWRNLTLFNSAYILRNISEESLRASFYGRGSVLNDPAAYLGLVYQTVAAMDGQVMFKRYSRSMRRLRRLQNVSHAQRFRPETYRGSYLIETNALRDLLSGNVDDAGDMIGVHGRKTKVGKVAKDIAEHGVMEPIVISFDSATGNFKIGDGMKRAILAMREGADEVPIVIQPGKVEAGEGLASGKTGVEVVAQDLFGDGVIGDTADVMAKARSAVEDYVGWRRVMRYINPYYRTNVARVNGEDYFARMKNASVYGDEEMIDAISRMFTMNHGSNLIDEAPQAAGFRHGATAVTYESDSTHYAETLADSIGDALRSAEVRDWLQGKRSIDRMVDDIINDPRRAERVYAAIDVARLAKANGKRLPGDSALTISDIERMVDLDNDTVRVTLKDLLEAQIKQANVYFGQGTSRALQDALTKGSFEGAPLSARNHRFVAFLHKELGDNDALRGVMPPQLTPVIPASRKRSVNLMFNKFFEMAGSMRDLITLSPLMREAYAEETMRLVRYASDADRARMAQIIRDAGDEPLARKVAASPSAGKEGIVDAEMIEHLADRHARKVAREMYYDASERRNWAVAFRWAAPFAQAAANTTYVWGKAMATRTPDVYRTIRGLEAVKDMDLGLASSVYGFHGDADPALSRDGQMYRDSYGEERFLYPALGVFANFLPFATRFTATAGTKSVDLFQDGLLQTSGPVLQWTVSQVFPDAQARDDIVGTVTRFTNAYPIPTGTLAERTIKSFTPSKWRNILGDENRQTDLVQSVYAARLQSGDLHAKYGDPGTWDEATVKAINEDVRKTVGWTMMLEAIGKNLFPTMGAWRFEPIGTIRPEDVERYEGAPVGDVLMSELAKELYKTVGDSTGEEYRTNLAAFHQQFGEYADLDTLSTRDSEGMVQGVGDVTDFAYDERKLYDTYHSVIGYLFPKGDYASEWEARDSFLRARNEGKGYTTRRSTEEQLDFVHQYILRAAYKKQMDDLDASGGTSAQKQRLKESMMQAGYDSEWSEFDAQQMSRVVSMLTGEDAERLRNLIPAAPKVATYLAAREQVRNRLEQTTDSLSLSSQQALEAAVGVEQLYAAGMALASQDKGFRNFWSMAEREFGDNSDRIMEGLQ